MQPSKYAFIRVEKGQIGGEASVREIPLTSDTTVIGRPTIRQISGNSGPDIVLNDDYISRFHATISFNPAEGHYSISERENGTENGTFVNNKRLQPGEICRLKDGDQIGLARIANSYRAVFTFRENDNTLVSSIVSESLSTPLTIDVQARRVSLSGNEITLRRKEFDLLAYLFQNKGIACSKDAIAEAVWADEQGIVSQETIDTNIHRIREKIEPDPAKPTYIVTLPRYGYRFDQ